NNFSTKNPVSAHQQKIFTVTFADANKNSLGTTTVNGTYDSPSELYKGNTNFTIPAGSIFAFVSTPGHLRKLAGNISGQTTVNLTGVNLIAGDLNDDKTVGAVDYGIFLSCSIFTTDNHSGCGNNAQAADFNGDGKVDQLDYNLLLREFGANAD